MAFAWSSRLACGDPGRKRKAGPVQCREIGVRKRMTELFPKYCRCRGRAMNENDVPFGIGLFQFVAAQRVTNESVKTLDENGFMLRSCSEIKSSRCATRRPANQKPPPRS